MVIVAVQPDRLARLAPPAAGIDREPLARLGSSPIVNLHFVFDRQVTEHEFAAGVGTPVQWVFDRTDSAGTRPRSVPRDLAVGRRRRARCDRRPSFASATSRRSASCCPGARDADVETFFVTREHAATFRAAPGARALRPGPRTRLPGLVLAGSWTDTGWPATMEGAVRSGHAAAREALTALAAQNGSRNGARPRNGSSPAPGTRVS